MNDLFKMLNWIMYTAVLPPVVFTWLARYLFTYKPFSMVTSVVILSTLFTIYFLSVLAFYLRKKEL